MASLSHFLPKLAEKARPFYKLLKKTEPFNWDDNCEAAFQNFKKDIATPLILTRPRPGSILLLYLLVAEEAVSSALIQEEGKTQKPVYFISCILRDAEKRYQLIEKVALALVTSARRLRPYFQSHPIIVKTDHPIRQVLKKPELAGRMIAWSVELSEFDISFEPRGPVKSQALADFVADLTMEHHEEKWDLYVDGASSTNGIGAGIILEGPRGITVEHALRFNFKASNNQAEYEALIAGLKLAKEMGAQRVRCHTDSQLVQGQVSDRFQAKETALLKYYQKVKALADDFASFEVHHIPRENNTRADLLSKLASTRKPSQLKTIIQERLLRPTINNDEVMHGTQGDPNWMTPI